MRRSLLRTVLVMTAVGLAVWLGGLAGMPGSVGSSAALAAESLNVEGLPENPTAYRQSVRQILDRTDRLIDQLKEDPSKEVVALELIQARDNVYQEAYKVDHFPEGAAWTAEEARANTDAMLKNLKAEYEKAAESAEASS